jgi:hypothetical protein
MLQLKHLATLALLTTLLACSGTGKEVVLTNGDAQNGEDLVTGDTTVSGDALLPPDDILIPPNDVPVEEVAPGCEATCEWKVCGEINGCLCGTCPPGTFCDDDGLVCEGQIDVVDPCDLNCEGVECGEVGGCDCGTCDGGMDCVDNQCMGECTPQCTDDETGDEFQCGDDGCEGNCGECGIDEWCEGHMCLHDDPPDCEAACGTDEFDCGEIFDGMCDCGNCAEGYECTDNFCTVIPPDCDVLCEDKECGGTDGCDCGACDAGFECNDEFSCICSPECDGKECGPDGCDGICGSCDYGTCENGVCECTPNCAGKNCGSDGCGGSCGSCPGNNICTWAGDCVASCTPQTVSFSDDVQKLVTMQMGQDGMDGEALDVDGNPATCSPFGKCENGNDNSLSNLFTSIADFIDINASLDAAVQNGSVVMVAEMVGYVPTGLPFSLNMYIAEPSVGKNQCNFQTTKCNYLVESSAIDWVACAPLVTFDNAKVVDSILTAGGNGYELMLPLPFFGGQPLLLLLSNARIQAKINIVNGTMKFSDGVIGGAIDKQLLIDAVDDLPEGGLPVSKDMIKSLLNMLINNDVDTTGDGKKDKASMGIKFTTIPGAIIGVM